MTLKHKITNIKVSLKSNRFYSLNEIKTFLKAHKIQHKDHKNFIVFNLNSQGKFVVSVFKTTQPDPETKKLNHINITKLSQLSHILEATKALLSIGIGLSVKDLKIDNICAKADFKKCINLIDFIDSNNDLCFKYHNEVFPGLFIKFRQGTFILFKSGKIICMGAKAERDISDLLNNLNARLETCTL